MSRCFPGVMMTMGKDDLPKRLIERIGQTVLTCPTTACYDGLPEAPDRLGVGSALRFFGDGFQASKVIGGERFWRIPVMEGEFVVQEKFGMVKGVGGGNFLILARTADAALAAAEAAAEAIAGHTGVILPFPGGVVRSGSKVGSRRIKSMNSPRAIERTVDKFWTSALLEQCGLPTPDTVVCETSEEAIAAFRAMGDVIVKPLFGSMGLGMVRVSDEEMAFRVFKTIETIRGVYYLQRTIDHEGRDIRAFVVGGRVLAAIERRSDGWRTNLSRGGTARPVRLSEAWGSLAVRAAAAVGAEYAGVDLLPARDGSVYVLEVNGIPGWEGLQAATGLDVAGAVIDQLVGPGT